MKNNKQYSLKFSTAAVNDLRDISEYIRRELSAPLVAKRKMKTILDSLSKLKDFPKACELIKIEKLKLQQYRRLVIDNYLAFYITDDDQHQITVVRILYNKRDYENIL